MILEAMKTFYYLIDSLGQMSRKLDELGLCCREYLASRHHPKILDDSRDQLVESCKCICDFMRSQGFGNAERKYFYYPRI